jgi:hypothetical protein
MMGGFPGLAIVGQAMLLVAIGVLCGLAAAYDLSRLLEQLLFGVKMTNPLTYAVVTVLLTSVAYSRATLQSGEQPEWTPRRPEIRVISAAPAQVTTPIHTVRDAVQ